MRFAFRITAVILAVATVAVWLATGADRGWTKTLMPVITVDEVTGIEGPTSHQKGFWPGVDFLGAGLGAAAVLAGASLLFRKSDKPSN